MARKPKKQADPHGSTPASGSDRHLSQRTQVNRLAGYKPFTSERGGGGKIYVKDSNKSKANYDARMDTNMEPLVSLKISQAELLRMQGPGAGRNKGYKSTLQTGKNKKK